MAENQTSTVLPDGTSPHYYDLLRRANELAYSGRCASEQGDHDYADLLDEQWCQLKREIADELARCAAVLKQQKAK